MKGSKGKQTSVSSKQNNKAQEVSKGRCYAWKTHREEISFPMNVMSLVIPCDGDGILKERLVTVHAV